MANIDFPGFRPADRKPDQDREFIVDASNGTNLFVGDVVTANGAGSVRPAAADDGASVAGVVLSIRDTNGISIGHPNSLVSEKYLPSSTAGLVLVALALPGRIFIAQGQTGQTITTADYFATTDHVAGAGDTTKATSGHELNLSDLNTGAQCLILGAVAQPSNDVTLANAELYVTFNESIFCGVGKAVGV